MSKCSNCVKFKTEYCPCSIDCMATDDYPYFQDKRMILKENQQLKENINKMLDFCYGTDITLSEYDILKNISEGNV